MIILGIFALWLHSGCMKRARPKTDWRVNMSRDNKNPYGLYLTYKSLAQLFPGVKREALKTDYRLTNLGYRMRKDQQPSLLVMIGDNLNFYEGEIDSILAYVASGHQVLLSAGAFDPRLLARLQVKHSYGQETPGSTTEQIFIKNRQEQAVSYTAIRKQYSMQSCFKAPSGNQDPPYYDLGTNQQKKPDYIVYAIGKGKLFLHAEPLLFSNYFLLQQQNRNYLGSVFSFMPAQFAHIYWSDFNTRSTDHSNWNVIWKNPATRYALLLALLALLVYLAFEMKRRQRIIPIIPPAENASVAFVETIGRLYYNKKNHTNLAEKMVQHFLDYVRSNYYLNTNIMDQEFIRHLAAKSGKSQADTEHLVGMIKEVQQGIKADEQFLHSLYTQIQSFYNGQHG